VKLWVGDHSVCCGGVFLKIFSPLLLLLLLLFSFFKVKKRRMGLLKSMILDSQLSSVW
jgi:hypothetical protein